MVVTGLYDLLPGVVAGIICVPFARRLAVQLSGATADHERLAVGYLRPGTPITHG